MNKLLHPLFVLIRPGQSQPVAVHVVIVFHHVVGRLVGGDENYLELSRRLALLHQLRVEVAQDGREVAARRAPAGGEVDPHHFVLQRLLGLHEFPVLVEQGSTREYLHHVRSKSRCQ